MAAVACHRAELLGTPVYDGPYARAAALAHILGRCRWLERSNRLRDPACTAARIAALLRTFPRAT